VLGTLISMLVARLFLSVGVFSSFALLPSCNIHLDRRKLQRSVVLIALDLKYEIYDGFKVKKPKIRTDFGFYIVHMF
jgi:hypothetical protein